ncbi:MAG: UbiX family flavin prenyltransferase, partial [Chloroflexi bacterium]
MSLPRRLIVGISGASGAVLAIRLLEVLAQDNTVETHLVISPAARITLRNETDRPLREIEALADVVYKPHDIGAAIASGSFPTHGMVVIPCSIKTLSAIAHSYAADLLTRAADVTLKEGRPLL